MEKNKPILVLNDMGGEIMSVSYDITATLRANMKHHEPIVLVYDARGNGDGGGVPNNHGRPPKPSYGLYGNRGGSK